ncbi:MAG: HEAT repeat domain-containing protein [Dehalococcoidia bacterium]
MSEADQVPQAEPLDAAAIEALIKDLTSRDDLTRQKARLALVEIGSPAVPYLIQTLQHKRDWVRWEAAKGLAEIGDAAAVQALAEALRDNMFEVRWLAAQGLVKIGWRSIIPVVESLLDHSDSMTMRDGAHHVLHDIVHARFNEPLKPLLTSLEGIEPAVTVPLVGRAVLESLRPIEAQVIKEEQEAREKAEAELEAQRQNEERAKKKA